MKIILCLKAVPGAIRKWKLAGNKIDYQSVSIVLNEGDDYALEEALFLKRKSGAEVIGITAGSLTSQQALHYALAKGIDRAVRIDFDSSDAAATSLVLSAAIKRIGFDLVLTGVESSDGMNAQVGGYIAARLNLPFAYAVVGVDLSADSMVARVHKEAGGGAKQVMEITLPCVLAIQSGIQPLTFAPVRKLLDARTRRIEGLSPGDLGIDESALREAVQSKIVDVFVPVAEKQAIMLQGKPPEIARQLIQKIKEAM